MVLLRQTESLDSSSPGLVVESHIFLAAKSTRISQNETYLHTANMSDSRATICSKCIRQSDQLNAGIKTTRQQDDPGNFIVT